MRIMIKFAKSMYSSFDSKVINLKVLKDQVFAVTPEIEASSVYQDGIATKNFIPVTIANAYELTKVVNLSDAVRAEFAKTQSPSVPVPVVVAPKPIIPVPKPITKPTVAPKPAPIEVEPTLSFTEEAGNQKNAFEAISKMTDIKKLEHALKTDDRVGVQKALQKRIEELTE
jgi:hypothetical protein